MLRAGSALVEDLFTITLIPVQGTGQPLQAPALTHARTHTETRMYKHNLKKISL